MFERVKELLRRVGEKILARKSYIVLVCGFGFLAGVIIHSFLDIKIGSFWLYNAMLAAGAGMIIFGLPREALLCRPVALRVLRSFNGEVCEGRAKWGRDKKIFLVLLGLFFIVAGFARFDLSVRENKVLPQYFGRDVEITGVVADEPAKKIDKQQLVIRPESFFAEAPHFARPSHEASERHSKATRDRTNDKERILVTTGLYPEYSYGDRLRISCRLVEPKEFSDFNYAKWLTINDIYGLCYWPEITRIHAEKNTTADTRGIMAALLRGKNFLIGRVNGAMPEPFASFLSGLVLGARSSMPPALLQNFQRAGITHIIAISGWNISFLAYIFLPAFFILHIRRGKAFYIMLALIFSYAILTGASASVIRAAIMGATLLLAQKMGRLNSGGRALLYAVTAMFLINPRAIYDAGFWLSASATFGLIYFAPILLAAGFDKIRSRSIREYIVATITAVIFTLPVSSYIFGGVSLWALIVNLLVLPLVPPAFVASLIGMSGAAVLPVNFAGWILFPAASILNYIIKIAEFFGRLPFGFVEWRMPIIIVIAYYAALLFFTFKKLKERDEEIF